jgi:hypothetical protein
MVKSLSAVSAAGLLLAAVLFFACATQKGGGWPDCLPPAQDMPAAEINRRQPVIKSHSFLSVKDEGAVITITGMLSGNKENVFFLTENPDRRNAVSFYLEQGGSSKDVYDELSSYAGSTVTISGVLLDASSMWTKKMSVVSIK